MASRRLRAPELAPVIDADDVVRRPAEQSNEQPLKKQRRALFTTGVLLNGISKLAKRCPLQVRGIDEVTWFEMIRIFNY